MTDPRVLIISGSMGAGKTTVMGEASDLLAARQIVHGAIDLDAIGVVLVPEPQSTTLHYQNLAAIYDNCRAAGIDRFLMAVAVESQQGLGELAASLKGATITICRLLASEETMADRLRTREVGIRQREFLERSAVLNAILDAASVEHFRIDNDGRDVTSVAEEMLVRAGWIAVR
jgi:ribose 1,5-bisphosphokinase PhnN